MRIQHNISALNSHRNLGINNSQTSKNLEKLSSGYRINRAGDDAAGLAISEKMRGQIRGLAQAEQNTSMGINLIQTAEGGLNETHAILQRMRELAVQSSNGTYQEDDREQLTLEFNALKDEIDRISTSTHYNGIKLLNGNLSNGGDAYDVTAVSGAANLLTSGITAAVAADDAGAAAAPVGVYTNKYSVEITKTDDGSGTGTFTYTATVRDKDGAVAAADIDFDPTSSDDLTITDAQGVDFAVTLVLDDLAEGKTNFSFDTSYELVDNSGDSEFKAAPTVEIESASVRSKTGVGENLVFQIGANGGEDQRVKLSVSDMSSWSIGGTVERTGTKVMLAEASIATIQDANDAIDIIDGATNMVSAQRAGLGALQNRLEHTLNNLGVTKENLTASESTIRDVDMASEMADYTKNSILVQAAQAMLAQANQLPQGVLQLLQ